MEYMPSPAVEFDQINSFLKKLRKVQQLIRPFGGNTLEGGLDAYRCVRSGFEKNTEDTWTANNENEIIDYLNQSFQGTIREKLIRFYLLYVLKITFTGISTSDEIGETDFEEVQSYENFWQHFEEDLYVLVEKWKEDEEELGFFMETLYKGLEEVVKPKDCRIYDVFLDTEKSHPIPGDLLCSSYVRLFYNEELGRVVIFWCCTSEEDEPLPADQDDVEDYFWDTGITKPFSRANDTP